MSHEPFRCEEAEKYFDELSEKYPHFTFIKVDSDANPIAQKYFGVKV